jgi:hypothetical protein
VYIAVFVAVYVLDISCRLVSTYITFKRCPALVENASQAPSNRAVYITEIGKTKGRITPALGYSRFHQRLENEKKQSVAVQA